MYDDLNPCPRFAALLASTERRTNGDTDRQIVGMTDNGALIVAEYDDGMTNRDSDGNLTGEVSGLVPFVFDLDHGHVILSVYPSGSIGVNVRKGGTFLIVGGRPERV